MNPTINIKIQSTGSGTSLAWIPKHYADDLQKFKKITLTGDFNKTINLQRKGKQVFFTFKKYSGFEIGETISLKREERNIFTIKKVVNNEV